MSALHFSERPAAAAPEGLLLLHHGRGSDERDLLGLADILDPHRRLHVVSPRAPLSLPGSPGHHWYLVPRVGTPDTATFDAAYAQLAAFHEETWARTGLLPAQTVLGGFSMGAVMSYALGLGPDRPAPGGILALSGFVPRVEGWHADLAGRAGLPVLIAHGRRDPVIDVAFGREAEALLSSGGLGVSYHETDAGHSVDPSAIPPAVAWLARALGGAGAGA